MSGEKKTAHGIVWIASYPKSGNTWTRVFLHNLLHILEGNIDELDINRLGEFTSWDLSIKSYEQVLEKPIADSTRAEIAAVRPQVQAALAERTKGAALVKTHHALVDDRGHPTINFAVTSGAVYVVRNPLDVAVSFAAHLSSDIDNAIDQMNARGLETDITEHSVYEVYGSWSEHVESWTRQPHRAVHVMRYEDMVTAPLQTFSNLASHLLLRPTTKQLTDAIDRSAFSRLKEKEAATGFREKPEQAERFFREGKTGQWRDALSRRQVRKIVGEHREQMRRFGYLSDDIRHLADG